MRRTSQSRLQTQMSEPLIVVEESETQECDDYKHKNSGSDGSSSEGSPTNPYLLSPWRQDARKHSLPTPQCSGITASQVRRLSERSGESAAQSAREAAFLATLSSNPIASPGGRRHSVVTISKVPSAFFGRNRRESVAASPSGLGGRLLSGRRESFAGPPSTEPRGSLHNLQLDIMDDIVRARKVRMKMWNTSNERVCELQPLDDQGGVQRYTNSSGRRYSDFVGTTLAPIPSSSKRRGSELPPTTTAPSAISEASKQSMGIICSNTDLISILSSLTSSAMEINQCDAEKADSKTPNLEQLRSRLKSIRSNSFDASTLYASKRNKQFPDNKSSSVPTNWFVRRHQPISSKTDPSPGKSSTQHVTFANEKVASQTSKSSKLVNWPAKSDGGKVVWDERSGSIVDPQLLGSAIEVFLRRGPELPSTSGNLPTTTAPSPSKGAIPKSSSKNPGGKSKTSWFSNKGDENDYSESCDSSSLCSTLKDLFVK